jgi:WD40 repeat protein
MKDLWRVRGLLLAGVLATLIAPTAARAAEATTVPTPSQVMSASVAAGAQRAAAICRDGKLRIWDIGAGRLLQTMEPGGASIDLLVLSPDGRWVFTGDHSGNAVVWDSNTGKAKFEVRLAHYPSAAAFSLDGKLLAIAPAGDPLQVFNVSEGRQFYATGEVTGGTTALAFSRDGTAIGAADADTAVRIYDARTGKLVAENHDFLLEPLALDFTADGKQVMAAGADKILAVIDAVSGRLVHRSEKTSEPVFYLATSPDGTSVALVFMKADNLSQPAPVAVWEVSSGKKKLEWLPPALALTGGWTRDGHVIAVTAGPDAMSIWQAE